MKLRELLKNCTTLTMEQIKNQELEREISGVAHDSRKVKEGYLFVAIKGEKYDGHNFISEALTKGASAIIHEKELTPQEFPASPHQLFVKVNNSRKALACISHNFYGMPSKNLILIGVTGTNGKTTTTYLIKSVLEAWGKEVGLIGTIHYIIKNKICPAAFTTPESLEFHGLLKDMQVSGCTHVISEVSSHALAQHRVDGTAFKAAVFMNLTRDHLDFHKTMEEYFRAKERLFIELLERSGIAVINRDDPFGRRIISSLAKGSSDFHGNILTYGIEEGADMLAEEITSSLQGLNFKISFRGGTHSISSNLVGMPNVFNIIAAASVATAMGIPWQTITEGLEKIGSVTGRFEKVEIGQGFSCIIDYAHTEDAIERLINTAKELAKNLPNLTPYVSPRVITVFGCGGDRDRGKRPKMGAIATGLSDFVIITSDNPRSEEPLEIIREIEEGTVKKNYIIEPDRREAIRKAVDMACDLDVILIAGKGHEDYQEIKGVRYRFNDREFLEEAIRDRMKRHGNVTV